MEFKAFKEKIQKHFAEMSASASRLYEVDVDKDQMWNLYLDSFPDGSNEIYREHREYDCSCCRQFIRAIGNAVVICDGKVETIWDVDMGGTIFEPVTKALAEFIKNKPVTDIYVSKQQKIGTDRNYETIGAKVHTWEHFYLELPMKFVDHSGRAEGDIKGEFRSAKQVLSAPSMS